MRQAMIFAAGMGTRLKPLTDVIPKAMVPVGDRPLLQIVIERLVDAGVTHFVVNVHHHAGQIRNFISLYQKANPHLSFRISDETDQLLETGGGVRKAAGLFCPGLPVLIHNCDILSNLDLASVYDAPQCDATLVVSERKTQRYLLFDRQMRLVGWTNIATGEVRSPYPDIDPDQCLMYAFSGIHLLSHNALNAMQPYPERFPIMDFYLDNCDKLIIKGKAVSYLQLLDVGKLDTLEQAGQQALMLGDDCHSRARQKNITKVN